MLSLRLQKIASLINSSDKVLDIGCDHAYLSIYLAKRNIKVLASDVNAKAMAQARINIKKENLDIPTILSDGLDNIDTQDFNTIVISGMGTSTILKILNNKEKLQSISKLIIQSNNNICELREKVTKMGYFIQNELVVLDNHKYYIIIEFQKGKKKYSYQDLMYGPVLSKDKKNKEYFSHLLDKNEAILKQIPKSNIRYRHNLKKHIRIIKKIINNN